MGVETPGNSVLSGVDWFARGWCRLRNENTTRENVGRRHLGKVTARGLRRHEPHILTWARLSGTVVLMSEDRK